MVASRIPEGARVLGRMWETRVHGADEPDESLVRDYLNALRTGRFLDALNRFSMDASLRDESGRERHGIREIAAAFARREPPLTMDIEDLHREGDVVSVLMRMTFPDQPAGKEYRNRFHIRHDRISSLEIDALPVPRARKDGLGRPS